MLTRPDDDEPSGGIQGPTEEEGQVDYGQGLASDDGHSYDEGRPTGELTQRQRAHRLDDGRD